MLLVSYHGIADESVYAGPGAGRYPTANSVVNDIVRLARQGAEATPAPFPVAKEWTLQADYEACFYARITAVKDNGILATVGRSAQRTGVSVHSVLRAPNGRDGCEDGLETVDVVLRTDKCKRSNVQSFLDAVESEPWARGKPVVMSILR